MKQCNRFRYQYCSNKKIGLFLTDDFYDTWFQNINWENAEINI